MTSSAATVEQYLAELPEDRRAAIQAVRQVVLDHLHDGLVEGMQYGMIGYYVPHSIYPAGYHCDRRQPLPFAGLASQKNHLAVYLFCIYADPEAKAKFEERYRETGKRMDMGAGCIRFKKVEDLPLDLLAETLDGIDVPSFIAHYEASIPASKRPKRA